MKAQKKMILLYDRRPEKLKPVLVRFNKTLYTLFKREIKKDGFVINLALEGMMLNYLKKRGIMDGIVARRSSTGPEPKMSRIRKRRKAHRASA